MRKIKTVLFTSLSPGVWQYKLALALRKKGIKTKLLYIKQGNKKFYSEVFDEIISLDLPDLKPKTIKKEFSKRPSDFAKFFYKMLSVGADAAIVQGPPNYLCTFFLWLYKFRFPTVYFPYDIDSARMKDTSILPKKKFLGERYCLENAKGVIYKDGRGVLSLLPKDYKIKGKIFNMPLYTTKEWFVNPEKSEKLSKKDKELHIVSPGTFYIQDKSADKSSIYNSMTDYSTHVMKQGMHIHYLVPGDTDKIEKEARESLVKSGKEKIAKYLHVHPFVHPDKLSSVMSKYDFGLYLIHYGEQIKEEMVKFTSGNKISSYLESGIPYIVTDDNILNSKMAKEKGIGISVKNLSDIKGAIKRFNYKKSINKIKEFREDYSFDNHIDEIIKFLSSLK